VFIYRDCIYAVRKRHNVAQHFSKKSTSKCQFYIKSKLFPYMRQAAFPHSNLQFHNQHFTKTPPVLLINHVSVSFHNMFKDAVIPEAIACILTIEERRITTLIMASLFFLALFVTYKLLICE